MEEELELDAVRVYPTTVGLRTEVILEVKEVQGSYKGLFDGDV